MTSFVGTAVLTIQPSKGAQYSAGQNLGGPQQINGKNIIGDNLGCVIQNIALTDPSGQDAATDLLFFAKQPVGSYIDGNVCGINALDAPYFMFALSLSGYKTYGTPGVTQLQNISLALNPKQAGGIPGEVWVIPVTQGTPTYPAGTQLTVSIGSILSGQ